MNLKPILALALPVAAVTPASAQDAAALIKQYNCGMCHQASGSGGVAPSFQGIAAKYAGDSGATAKLAAVIRNGGHGGGMVSMPATPSATEADARAIATYILAMKK